MDSNENKDFDSLERIFKESEEELKKNPKNIKALFNLTLLKVPFIKQNPKEILKDLSYLYKKIPSKRDILSTYIAQCYAELNDFDKAYKFAKEGLLLPEQLRYEAYFTLIQICMFKGNEYFDEALSHLDNALLLDLEEEIKMHFHSLKLELFIRKQDKEAFYHTLNEMYLIYGNRIEVLYEKINGILSFNEEKDVKEAYIEELIDLTEQYPEDFFINIGLVNLYKQLQKYNEALTALDKLDSNNDKLHDQIVKEKLDIYSLMEDNTKAVELLNDFMESTENKLLANILFYTFYTQDENTLFKSLPYIEEIYKLSPNDDIFDQLCRTLIGLDERKKLAEYAKIHLEKSPENIYAAYFLGQEGFLIGNSYDDTEENFVKSSKVYRLSSLYNLVVYNKNPEKYLKMFRKLTKRNLKSNKPRKLILLADIYLNGEFVSVKPKLAKKLLDNAQKILNNPLNVNNEDYVEIIDYSVGLMGRYYELVKKDYKTAGDFYEQGGTYYFDQPRDVLNQAVYYLHKYIKGIGTDINYDVAIKKLNDLNSEYHYLKGKIILQEAYLSMLGKYDKDVLEILKDLEDDYYFKRYDLNRYVILKQFTKKINVESMKLYELDFDACLKYTSHRCKKYYLEHKDDEVYYPFI